jgi:hypothetical protein
VWIKLKIETKMRKGKFVSKIKTVLGKKCPFMTNNKNLGKRIQNQNHTCTIHRNTTNSSIPLGSNIQFSTNTV